MSRFLFKLLAVVGISVIGAGVHLAGSWPVQLKAQPDDPTESTIVLPPLPRPSQPDQPEQDSVELVPSEPDPSETAPSEPVPSEPIGDDPDAEAADTPGSRTIVLDTIEIDFETAQLLHANGAATFVDARPADRYEAGHIQDALHISPAMLAESSSLVVLDVIDPEMPVVVYCGGGDCDDSHRVVELLQDLRGLTRTHVFTDGFPAWEAAGLPIGTGPDPWAE
ncbi:MAG: rhodanese-like domain-containing protein [Planctomycetota bacterium]